MSRVPGSHVRVVTAFSSNMMLGAMADREDELLDQLLEALPGTDGDADLPRMVRTMSADEKRDLARERAASGEPPEQTAHHMGISLATVYRYLKD